MKSTPFDIKSDLAPSPFDPAVCAAAQRLKEAGLRWKPQVGCFVWDRENLIAPGSPFPNNIYFILNLGHFLRRFETAERISQNLVWIPTCHQALTLCSSFGIKFEAHQAVSQFDNPAGAKALVAVFDLLSKHLKSLGHEPVQLAPVSEEKS